MNRLCVGLLIVSAMALVSSGCVVKKTDPAAQNTTPEAGGGGTDSTATDPAATGPNPRTLIGKVEDHMKSAGYVRVGPAQHNSNLKMGGQMAYRVEMQGTFCYAIIVLGAAGSNPNLLVRNPQGKNAGYDVDPDSYPWTSVCPKAPGRHTAIIQQPPGSEGEYYFMVYQGPGGQPVDLDPLLGTTKEVAQSPTAALDENFALVASDMQARGYHQLGASTPGDLVERGKTDFTVSLGGGKCYAVVAVGAPSVKDMDLILLDSREKELDRDTQEGAKPIVRVCPKETSDYIMRVEMKSGAGRFVYATYEWPRGTKGPFGLEGLIYLRTGEVTAILSQDGYEPDPDYVPETGKIAANGTKKHDLKLVGGACYSVLAVGGDGIHHLGLKLTSGGTTLVEAEQQSAFPSVRHCMEADGAVTAEIQAKGGSGEYFYQVFRQR